MESCADLRIKCVERLGNSVIVTFEDGKFAVYSAHLLREAVSESELMDEENVNDE